MDLVGLGPTTRKSSLHYNINNSSLFQVASYIVSSCQFCTDRYRAVIGSLPTCTTRCSVHMRSSHVRTQNIMQRPQVDLVDSNVYGCLYVFSMQIIVRIFSELNSALTPQVGPTNRQILATPLLVCGLAWKLFQVALCYLGPQSSTVSRR